MRRRRRAHPIIAASALLAAAGAAVVARAQSASSSLSSFSHGFAVTAGSLETPVNPQTHDASGAVSFVAGVIQPPSGSLFAAVPTPSLTGGVGAAPPAAPTAQGTSTTPTVAAAAQGARLDVVTSRPSAPTQNSSLVLNGKVDLDGGP